MKYDVISWENIDEAIEVLAKKIEESKIKYEVIYGLARGGLVPAVMLSHRLKVPMVLNMEEVWRLKVKDKSVLIVDDISDTGETLKYFYDQKFDIATLFIREHTSKIRPKYIYKSINHDDWLLFPWETKSSSK
ncbi:phosphoribosyltransferase [Brachyspira pilosicoli]|uniref:Phosphoribosyltransferase n=1 Tax=Brachyspira pilosicoli TaxID=52584 RepID=A0A5C8EKB8_BRAPL|nr:phosphoribosyltransferase family protein [Brachyspira pilosicoli]TXJ37411.1 phosphoribosyltransferase [Brachyspira pilosicoli]